MWQALTFVLGHTFVANGPTSILIEGPMCLSGMLRWKYMPAGFCICNQIHYSPHCRLSHGCGHTSIGGTSPEIRVTLTKACYSAGLNYSRDVCSNCICSLFRFFRLRTHYDNNVFRSRQARLSLTVACVLASMWCSTVSQSGEGNTV